MERLQSQKMKGFDLSATKLNEEVTMTLYNARQDL